MIKLIQSQIQGLSIQWVLLMAIHAPVNARCNLLRWKIGEIGHLGERIKRMQLVHTYFTANKRPN